MPARRTLITGGSGYLGRMLAQRLLVDESHELTLWLHAPDASGFEERANATRTILGDAAARVRFVGGSLRDAEPFKDLTGSDFDLVIHAAAITRFDVQVNDAQAVNVEGAQKLFAFTQTLPSLSCLLHLTTVYASGMASGPISETIAPAGTEFCNHYEASKSASERILASDFKGLPWRILRLCTIVADAQQGGVSQLNVFHNTMKLLFFGFLSVIPGKADTPVYISDGERSVDAILNAVDAPQHQLFHLCPPQSAAVTLGEVVDIAMEVFGEHESFKKRRVLRPLLVEDDVFGQLARGMGDSSMLAGSLQSMEPFARQLSIAKDLAVEHAQKIDAPYEDSYSRDLVRATLRSLVEQAFALAEGG